MLIYIVIILVIALYDKIRDNIKILLIDLIKIILFPLKVIMKTWRIIKKKH